MIDQHKTLSEKFLKKGFWLYLFSFIIAPIGYIVKIIVSGELAVEEVGILYGVISITVLVGSYNDLGITDSLNYFIPKFVTEKRYDKVKSILVYALIIQMITGVSISLLLFFGADYIANNYFKTVEASPILKIFSLYFLGINIFQIISTFLMAIQNTFLNKILELIRMCFVLLSVLFIFFTDISSLIYYSFSWVIGLYIGILFATYLFIKKYYNTYLKNEKILWDKKLFKTIFTYAITIYIGVQAGTILSQVDMQMIIYMLGTKEAGYYTNYLTIISIPFMLIVPIFGLLYPIFSELNSKGEIEKIKLIKSIFQKNFLIIGIAVNILFFVFSEIIAYILFGEKFIESGVILKYSVLFLVFNLLLQINFNLMGGIGKVKERVKIISIALVFNIITNYILIKTIGVYGAALATGIGWILIWVLSEYYLGKKYIIKLKYLYIIKNTLILGLVGILSYYYILPEFESLSRINSFLLMGLFTIIYFGIFVLINYTESKLFILEIKKLRK